MYPAAVLVSSQQNYIDELEGISHAEYAFQSLLLPVGAMP
jgi:hypothetical protein